MNTSNITLADAIAVSNVIPMPDQTRQASTRSITRLCKHLDRSAESIPASLPEVERIIGTLNGEAFGIAPHSFKMMCSDIRRAVKIVNGCGPDTVSKARTILKQKDATLADVIAAVRLQQWGTTETRNITAAIKRFAAARKAASSNLAELGCSVHEIMSITGHESVSEVQRYTKAAEQKRLAERVRQRHDGGSE